MAKPTLPIKDDLLRQATNRPAARERLLNTRIPAVPIVWTRDELYERSQPGVSR